MAKTVKNKVNPLLEVLNNKDIDLIILQSEYDEISNTIADREDKLKSEIDKLKFDYNDLLYAGLSDNDKIKNLTDCASSMSDELVHKINDLFPVINKSPYSCSVYGGEKDW